MLKTDGKTEIFLTKEHGVHYSTVIKLAREYRENIHRKKTHSKAKFFSLII